MWNYRVELDVGIVVFVGDRAECIAFIICTRDPEIYCLVNRQTGRVESWVA